MCRGCVFLSCRVLRWSGLCDSGITVNTRGRDCRCASGSAHHAGWVKMCRAAEPMNRLCASDISQPPPPTRARLRKHFQRRSHSAASLSLSRSTYRRLPPSSPHSGHVGFAPKIPLPTDVSAGNIAPLAGEGLLCPELELHKQCSFYVSSGLKSGGQATGPARPIHLCETGLAAKRETQPPTAVGERLIHRASKHLVKDLKSNGNRRKLLVTGGKKKKKKLTWNSTHLVNKFREVAQADVVHDVPATNKHANVKKSFASANTVSKLTRNSNKRVNVSSGRRAAVCFFHGHPSKQPTQQDRTEHINSAQLKAITGLIDIPLPPPLNPHPAILSRDRGADCRRFREVSVVCLIEGSRGTFINLVSKIILIIIIHTIYYLLSSNHEGQLGPRWLGGYPARLPPRRTGFNSRPGNSRGIAPGDAAGCRVFFGDIQFPPHLHSGAAPFSHYFTLIGSRYLFLTATRISPPNSTAPTRKACSARRCSSLLCIGNIEKGGKLCGLYETYFSAPYKYRIDIDAENVDPCRLDSYPQLLATCRCRILGANQSPYHVPQMLDGGSYRANDMATPAVETVKRILDNSSPTTWCIIPATSHRRGCEPDSIPGGVTPGFSHVGIVPSDSAARQVFSGISCFSRPCIPALFHAYLTLIGSQDLDLAKTCADLRKEHTLQTKAGWVLSRHHAHHKHHFTALQNGRKGFFKALYPKNIRVRSTQNNPKDALDVRVSINPTVPALLGTKRGKNALCSLCVSGWRQHSVSPRGDNIQHDGGGGKGSTTALRREAPPPLAVSNDVLNGGGGKKRYRRQAMSDDEADYCQPLEMTWLMKRWKGEGATTLPASSRDRSGTRRGTNSRTTLAKRGTRIREVPCSIPGTAIPPGEYWDSSLPQDMAENLLGCCVCSDLAVAMTRYTSKQMSCDTCDMSYALSITKIKHKIYNAGCGENFINAIWRSLLPLEEEVICNVLSTLGTMRKTGSGYLPARLQKELPIQRCLARVKLWARYERGGGTCDTPGMAAGIHFDCRRELLVGGRGKFRAGGREGEGARNTFNFHGLSGSANLPIYLATTYLPNCLLQHRDVTSDEQLRFSSQGEDSGDNPNGGNGISPRKPADHRPRPARFAQCDNPPGIEPGSDMVGGEHPNRSATTALKQPRSNTAAGGHMPSLNEQGRTKGGGGGDEVVRLNQEHFSPPLSDGEIFNSHSFLAIFHSPFSYSRSALARPTCAGRHYSFDFQARTPPPPPKSPRPSHALSLFLQGTFQKYGQRLPPGIIFFKDNAIPGAYRNRAGRCQWSAGFLGDLPFPPPFHSGAAPYSPRFTSFGSRDLDVKSRPTLFSHCLATVKRDILSGNHGKAIKRWQACDGGNTARRYGLSGASRLRGFQLTWAPETMSPGDKRKSAEGDATEAPILKEDKGVGST
ncbi:hypothetical protein PR048_025923 [Dryococelus australis]|uniref:Uncharacterized protein n=1 Tax=Dryococelus australis TaxID=614101 RepID=A0ABQ9GJZ5_9NEOP|nr:hypothetical protein PR048_025923 [Dryococelus australis]